jgi:hypothetical protein
MVNNPTQRVIVGRIRYKVAAIGIEKHSDVYIYSA